MSERIPFTYGEFYNVPRMIEFEYKGKWYFLRSEFEDEKDDYSDCYDVYQLRSPTVPGGAMETLSWMKLSKDDYLGSIPIADVGLDESKRGSIDGDAFASWLARQQR